jgi:hypothetical protein
VRGVTAFLVIVAVLIAAGCGSEDSRQAAARVAVEDALDAGVYVTGKTRCTDDPSPWFIKREADVFICAAVRHDSGCDWYRATLKNAGWDVALDRPNAGCVLPL